MKEETKGTDEWAGNGYVTDDRTPNIIIGKLLTLIEVMGLTEKQEKSLGDLMRQSVWDEFNHDTSILISAKRHTTIRKEFNDKKLEAKQKGELLGEI